MLRRHLAPMRLKAYRPACADLCAPVGPSGQRTIPYLVSAQGLGYAPNSIRPDGQKGMKSLGVFMGYESLILEKTGHVAVLTLNRPEKLNAFDRQLSGEFHAALNEVEAGFPDIRALVLTGAGRGFCSGADVSILAEDRPSGQESDQRDTHAKAVSSVIALGPRLPQLPQPVIAAVNGVAAGAGLAIALASDIRVASDQARFSSVFIKRAMVPDNCASYFLPSLAGWGVAAEMALTGRIYDAQQALQMGLVNNVVPADRLMEEARTLAEEIASNPPLAVRSTKQLLISHMPDLARVARQEYAANAPSNGSEDKREAVMSFIEKRAPVYHGR